MSLVDLVVVCMHGPSSDDELDADMLVEDMLVDASNDVEIAAASDDLQLLLELVRAADDDDEDDPYCELGEGD